MKIRHSWWRIRRSLPFVCHPLSRSHDFCMTRLCIWTPRTLPFVPAHPVGSRRASSSTEAPFTGSVCSPAPLRTVRSAEHVPFLQLSGKTASAPLPPALRPTSSTRSASAPDRKFRVRILRRSMSKNDAEEVKRAGYRVPLYIKTHR